MEITWRVINRDGEEGKGTGKKQHKWWVQNRQGEVKNSIGNGEAKELICMTHGHEPSGGKFWWEGGAEWRMGEKVQGIRRINGRYKIDRGRLRIV